MKIAVCSDPRIQISIAIRLFTSSSKFIEGRKFRVTPIVYC